MSSLATVDLPQPDSPTRPRVSPRRRVRSTPSTAWTWPTTRRAMTPWVSGKCLTRPRTSSSGPSGRGSGAPGTEDLLTVVAGAGPADGADRQQQGDVVAAVRAGRRPLQGTARAARGGPGPPRGGAR